MASCATARLVARTNATHASVIFNSSCVHVPDACERFLVRSITDGTLHRCRRSSKKDKCTLGEACEESVSREALAFDIGFFNGDDTALLLMQGYKVVAIEANAELVEQGRRRFAAALRNGQLVLLHRALAWSAETEGVVRPFYVNRHNQQWSSFHKAVGCRPASWPATQPTMSAAVGPDCDERLVRGESCMALFATYGTPLLLKLDIEGYEFELFRELPVSGVLCSIVSVLFVEWHPGRLDWRRARLPMEDKLMTRMYEWLLRFAPADNRANATLAAQPTISRNCRTKLLKWG